MQKFRPGPLRSAATCDPQNERQTELCARSEGAWYLDSSLGRRMDVSDLQCKSPVYPAQRRCCRGTRREKGMRFARGR